MRLLGRGLLDKLVARVRREASAALAPSVEFSQRSAIIAAKAFAQQCHALSSIESLADVEFRVFSQFGEDGILEWLIGRLPGIPQTFIEFGVEDYQEANTRFLLINRNWRGLVMDGSEANMNALRRSPLFWRHDLRACAAFIDAENIDQLILDQGFDGEIGVLSIDIDGNDFWVWKGITAVSPWVISVEYNAVLGDIVPLTIPYDPKFARFSAHSSGLYAGASIAAFEYLAQERGYVLMGSNLAGNNAFFIRADLANRLKDTIAMRNARPSRFRESRARDGAMTFLTGVDRKIPLLEMDFVDVRNDRLASLKTFGGLLSPTWTAF